MKDKNRVISTAALLFSIVFTYILFRILQPNRFGSLESMLMVLKQSLIPAVGACGCFFAYIVGLFDMSMGANIILSGLVGCMLSIRFGYIGLFAGSMATGLMVGTLPLLPVAQTHSLLTIHSEHSGHIRGIFCCAAFALRLFISCTSIPNLVFTAMPSERIEKLRRSTV